MPRAQTPQTRRQINRATNNAEMRRKISFTKTISRIMEVEQLLLDMNKPQTVFTQDGDIQVVAAQPVPATVASYKTVLDSCYKRMAKVLPDLRAEDHHTALGNDIEQDEQVPLMNKLEFKRRLKSFLNDDDPATATTTGDEPAALPAPETNGTEAIEGDGPEFMK